MFFQCISQWQRQAGRHDLAWQNTQDPYRVWLSEIMLQQTQVNTVLRYYARFLQRFPTVAALAQASQEELMSYWAGLGYYARARNLHKCAQLIMQEYDGKFPCEAGQLNRLPGIGLSTANSIAAFCFNAPTPILDGNVKRVFARYYGIEANGLAGDKIMWQQAYQNVEDQTNVGQYNQGLMDLGSLVCKRTKPLCSQCPLTASCYAYQHNLQTQLPRRKIPKDKPHRQVFMLVIRAGDQIFLQKRPEKGIWGGLLSLPEAADEAQLQTCLTQHGLNPAHMMAPFEHVFSHYRLTITPVLIEQSQTSLQESRFALEGSWYRLDTSDSLALPAPILKILQGVVTL